MSERLVGTSYDGKNLVITSRLGDSPKEVANLHPGQAVLLVKTDSLLLHTREAGCDRTRWIKFHALFVNKTYPDGAWRCVQAVIKADNRECLSDHTSGAFAGLQSVCKHADVDFGERLQIGRNSFERTIGVAPSSIEAANAHLQESVRESIKNMVAAGEASGFTLGDLSLIGAQRVTHVTSELYSLE
jgi:hypothetical protein